MFGGKGSKGQGYGQGKQNQYDINDAHLQAASGKVPPTWSPERQKHYSLLQYEQDLRIWAASTDVDDLRKGPLVALRLGGSAKVLMREMDVDMMSNGVDIADPNAQNGLRHISGCEFILRQLQRRFAPLAEEVQISCCNDLFKFQRWQGETIDEVISRFEMVMNRCENVGQVMLNEVIKAWMLLHIAGIPKDKWPIILAPTLGSLPNNPQQYNVMVQYIRRNGHLYENSKEGISQNFFTAAHDGPDDNSWHNDGWEGGYSYHASGFQSEVHEDDELSSGESHASEPVDNSDLAAIPADSRGEFLYLGYRTAKRKYRSFTGQPGRGRHHKFRKGSGKGGNKGSFHKGSFQKGGKK